jgi:hypothetical protein
MFSQARTVMLTSEVGGLAYDEAYKLLREWGRFELTGVPEKADLIFALRSDLSVRPIRPRDILWPYPYPIPYEQYLWLIVLDPKTDKEIWTEGQLQRRAFKEKNREKETILAVDALFKRLRERIPAR